MIPGQGLLGGARLAVAGCARAQRASASTGQTATDNARNQEDLP